MNITHRLRGWFGNETAVESRRAKIKLILFSFLLFSLFGLGACQRAAPETAQSNSNPTPSNSNTNAGAVYQTYGVHNSPDISPCASPDCVYKRGPGEPADPIYPEYWVSNWNMYRVFNKYSQFPPPYPKCSSARVEGRDRLRKSTGTTYYDSTWTSPGGEGAMMEHYENRCLPIFPISNKFTCSFISLRQNCLLCHLRKRPARRHAAGLSVFEIQSPRSAISSATYPMPKETGAQIGPGGQGYSFWVSAADGKPVQTGVSPDRTADQDIMFGYGFAPGDGKIMPQSFYFSGYPLPPANAPFVSQNYVDFKVVEAQSGRNLGPGK